MSLSNLLEFSVKMKDMMSGGLAKLASTAQNTFTRVQGNIDNVGKTTESVFKNVTKNISNSFDGVSARIKDTRKQLEELQRTRDATTRQTSGGGGFLGGMLRQAMPVVGIAGALALGGQALSAGLNAQARQASFNVLAGTEQGTKLNAGLTKYAQDSIYGTEVHDNAKTMLGFGIAAKDVLPNIKMLGDVAMGDANKLQSLTLAFSQVRSAGKLTGGDMIQFINAGFNPLNEIAKMTGKSMGTLKDEMSKGAISADMVQKAFEQATGKGGMFYKMADTIAQTDFGKWQAFQGQLDGLIEKIGGKLAPILGSLLSNYLVPFLNVLQDVGHEAMDLVKWVKQNADYIGLLAVVVGTASLAYSAYFIGVNAMSWALIAQTAVVGGLTTAWTWLNAVIMANPWGFIIAGIMAVVAGVIYAWNKFEGFRMAIFGLWGTFKQVFENIGNFFSKIFEPIFKAIDYFKQGKWTEAALEVWKMTPMGIASNVTKFALDGGFTKGIKEAYDNESKRGKNVLGTSLRKKTSLSEVADASKTNTSTTITSNEEVAKGITSGGARVININGVKFAEKIEFHVANMAEGAEQALTTFEDMFLRVLNSGAIVQ